MHKWNNPTYEHSSVEAVFTYARSRSAHLPPISSQRFTVRAGVLIQVWITVELAVGERAKRRADVVDIFPNEASITRLIGAVLFEQNAEWQTASYYMMVEAFAEIDAEETDPILSLTSQAA